MAGCRILGDAAVHEILIGLSRSDVKLFQNKLQESLRRYSVEDERKYQPDAGIINRPSGQKTLFRPFTSPSSVGTKIIVHPAPDRVSNTQQPLHGVIVLCDNHGIPTGLINAEEVTGFRTSLSALILWTWRKYTDSILVFGAGKQALWHIRLALALRGEEIQSVTVVNRNLGRADQLVKQLQEENAGRWKSEAKLESLDPNDKSLLQSKLAEVDAVFCTVPSEDILFPKEDLSLDSRKRAPYISAIGSWQSQMIELDPALLKHVAEDDRTFNLRDEKGGLIIVDDRDACLHHTGEVLQSGLAARSLLELGEVLDLQNQDESESQKREKFTTWLANGLIVYKSVGVSLTDLALGEAILDIAKQREMGTPISNF
ncbi:uncharacterized protein MYCFIDRAFT_134359 [Pseudocercospora fijiensis CIRAD86]|uniref:Quinate/shikimate 5-dehydrogenase/glutamyl-tRNA reductase domain-containing protein n=1 Tax=Pseudocercospora fijiensis (strain CIRAD86) TaxID=383855 RepID=M2ZZZ7_PSEFD|nr:uncharacterized protein MYCFIDRAFT_134359 [Pseudocercospora fijiensis CIRAD86]EME84489.1 hypothetical protein MYCFIDRAFT_134359 [Pseudocercospora fijiensis CIRAD86]